MVERYPNLKEEVVGSIPDHEISSLLDRETCQVVNCHLCFGVGMSAFCLDINYTYIQCLNTLFNLLFLVKTETLERAWCNSKYIVVGDTKQHLEGVLFVLHTCCFLWIFVLVFSPPIARFHVGTGQTERLIAKDLSHTIYFDLPLFPLPE